MESLKVFVFCFTALLSSSYAEVTTGTTGSGQRVNSTYYSYVIQTDRRALDYWVSLDGQEETKSLENKTASLAQLKFSFPFYGHLVSNVTVVKNGFLFMGRILHQYLSTTEFIAPLMANFNNSQSTVLYKSFHDRFVAQWKEVYLTEQLDVGTFSFQVTLYPNGTIAFIYKQIPINTTSIQDYSHPVKIGLSNAYFSSDLSTIYVYDLIRVNHASIKTDNVIIFSPNTTCNMMEMCSTCVSHSTRCKWCDVISRCSDGVDWYKQQWDESGCPQNSTRICSAQNQDSERDDGRSENVTSTTPMEIPTVRINDPVADTPRPVTSFSGGTTESIPATIAPGDQLSLEIDSIGSRSVGISWVAAVDSEFPVQYVVQLRTAATSWYNHTYDVVKTNAERRSTTIGPLLASTVYNIRMYAYMNLGRTGYTTVIAFQTTSSEDDTSGTNTTPYSLLPVIFSIFISNQIKD